MQNLSVKRMLALSVVGRAIREIETESQARLAPDDRSGT